MAKRENPRGKVAQKNQLLPKKEAIMKVGSLQWKERFVWLAVLCLIIVAATATIGFVGKDNAVAAHLSFASALVSIVLAVVAILYTIVQGFQTQQNVDKMGSLLEEGQRVMAKQVEAIDAKSGDIAEDVRKIVDSVGTGGGDAESVAETGVLTYTEETFSMNAGGLQDCTLLVMYILGLANQKGKRLNGTKVHLVYGPDVSERLQIGILSMVVTASNFLGSFLAPGSIRTFHNIITVNSLPKDFLEYIDSEVKRRTKEGILRKPYGQYFEGVEKILDQLLLG